MFALDTDDAVIDIDGNVNMRDETMDLGVHPHTKGFRVFSLRSPLYAKGTFKNPHVGVNAAALALRGGAAVGLGLINPFAALLPLLAPSNNKPLPCAQLLSQVRQAPTAPLPGSKQQPKPAISLEGVPVNKRSSGAGAGSARGHRRLRRFGGCTGNAQARADVARERRRIQVKLRPREAEALARCRRLVKSRTFGGGLFFVLL